MKKNDLKEFFGLLEGADDMKNRKMAEDSYDQVLKKMQAGTLKPSLEDEMTVPSWVMSIPQGKSYRAVVFDLSSIPDHEGIDLALGVSDADVVGGLFSMSTSKKKERISLTGALSADQMEKWQAKAFRQPDSMLIKSTNHTAYIHEFIHHLDRARVSKKAWSSQIKLATNQGGPNYFNNSIEMNAFTQMGLSAMARHLKNVKTKEGAAYLMGKTPQAFAANALKHMDQEFVANLNQDNRKKILKRIYQLYTDVMKNLK